MTSTEQVTSYFGVASELREIQEQLEHLRQWVADHDTSPPGDLNPTAFYLTNAIDALNTSIREASLAAQEQEESHTDV